MKLNLKVSLFFIVFSITSGNAQFYVVNTPVNETLTTHSYSSYGICNLEFPDVTIVFPKSTVTGVDHIGICTNIIANSPVFTGAGDTLIIGDTLYFNQVQNCYKLYSESSWTIDFTMKAIGIPTIGLEAYNCSDIFWFDGAADCDNFLSFMYSSNQECTVIEQLDNLATIEKVKNSEFNFWIKDEMLMIKNDQILSNVALYDMLGNSVLHSNEIGAEMNINISNLSAGFYIIEAYSNSNIIREKVKKN